MSVNVRTTNLTQNENCSDIARKVSGVFQPKTKQDIVKIVTEARKNKIKLHPVSTGKNWGYGSATPYQDNTWILDLSQMNQVLSYDPDLHVVRIQPGVTQKILYDFLEQYGHQHLVPTTGAGKDVSILGNSLERGYALIPFTDHFLSLTAFEVVLGSGDIYQSTFSKINTNNAGEVYKWGLGPYFDGLFSQSDLGIVTEASLLLQPRPENITLCFLSLKSKNNMFDTIKNMQILFKSYGSLCSGFNLLNNIRMLSMKTRCPEENIKSGDSLTPTQIDKLCLNFSVAPWTIVCAFYGTNKIAELLKKDIRIMFKNSATKISFINDKKHKRIEQIFKTFSFLKKTNLYTQWQTTSKSFQIFSGHPSNVAHQLVHWRNLTPPHKEEFENNFNPDIQKAGLIWYAPVICLKSSALANAELMMNDVCRKYGFDPLITFTVTNPRYAIATLALVFNRQTAGESDRAHSCYQDLYKKGCDLGIMPYRYGLLHLHAEGSNNLGQIHQKIKMALDPDNIISPGRFVD